ncbi:MAG: insulinase family protein [Chitinophagaceae bacterium]|nr:insulinase family protein [Chitinophagaceae bacterium]
MKKALADKGAFANGTTWYDRTNYYEILSASDENLKWAIDMEADRMINCKILPEELAKEFSVVRNEFEMGENYPSSVLMERVFPPCSSGTTMASQPSAAKKISRE